MKCPNCGIENVEGSKVCSNCGYALNNNIDDTTGVFFNQNDVSNVTKEKEVVINNSSKVKNTSNDRLKKILIIFISVIVIVSLFGLGIRYIINNYNVDTTPTIDSEDAYSETNVSLDGYKFVISSYYSYLKSDDNNYIVISSSDEDYYAYFAPTLEEYNITSISSLKTNLKNNGMVITKDQTYENNEDVYTVFTGTVYGKTVNVVYTKLYNNSLIGYLVFDDQDSFENVLTDFNDIILTGKKMKNSETKLTILSEIPYNLVNPFE